MDRFNLITGLLLLFSGFAGAQDLEKKNIYYGNDAYMSEEYDDAIEYYLEAIETNPLSFKANYNLANAFFKKKDFKQAADLYGAILDLAPTAYDRSMVYHNLGNSFMMGQQLDDAIEAYKSALKLNPKAEDTRYNLAYALELKKQQEQNQQNQQNPENNNQNQQNNPNDQQNQDQQNQDQQNQDQQNQDQQNQDQSNQNNSDQEKQDQGQQNGQTIPKISKEQAKRILDAALREEKDTRKQIEKNKQVGTGSSKKKDW